MLTSVCVCGGRRATHCNCPGSCLGLQRQGCSCALLCHALTCLSAGVTQVHCHFRNCWPCLALLLPRPLLTSEVKPAEQKIQNNDQLGMRQQLQGWYGMRAMLADMKLFVHTAGMHTGMCLRRCNCCCLGAIGSPFNECAGAQSYAECYKLFAVQVSSVSVLHGLPAAVLVQESLADPAASASSKHLLEMIAVDNKQQP